MPEDIEKIVRDSTPENDGEIKIMDPDPLPGGSEIFRSAAGTASESDEETTETDKIPSPSPRSGNSVSGAETEEPLSLNTISIKRSSLEQEKTAGIEPEKRTLKISCYHCRQKLDLTEMEPFSTVNCPSCNIEIIVPKWFDNYLLEEPGGRGGMATVYRALDLALDREVAIKVLNPEVASEAERSHLFLHEARTAATINHYAVLPIYTCGEFEDQPYIVMQYMDGGSLDKKLEESKNLLPIADVVKWIRDIAEGLDNARRHGIIHHDIKPANIMMDRDGNVKVGDFGIAQAIRDARSETISKITGTWASPHYVSPEKVRTGKEDHMGDIYSLGASFYQLLTGHTPFEIDDIESLVKIRLEQDPPNPGKHRPDIPPLICEVVLSMMSRTPDRRPTYMEITGALNAFLKEHEKGKDSTEKKSGLAKTKIGGKIFSPAGSKFKAEKYGKEKKTYFNLIIHLLISITMICSLYLLWQKGCFSKSIKDEGAPPEDFIPETARLSLTENRESAASEAEKALKDKYETKMELFPREPATSIPAPADETTELKPAAVPSTETSTLEAPDKSEKEDNKLKSLDLKDLTAEWLKERRSFASGRPRPADYEFKQKDIKAYLEKLPKENREMEERRARQVGGIKQYAVNLMSKLSYDKSVKLKNGRTYTGSIMANPKFISIHVAEGRFERVNWSSIGADQLAQILEHYADFRMKAAGGAAASKSKQKLEAAEDYLRIGTLYDWYGNYAEAVRYAEKALSISPDIETSVKCYMMQ